MYCDTYIIGGSTTDSFPYSAAEQRKGRLAGT
jgi:hypothetical protein